MGTTSGRDRSSERIRVAALVLAVSLTAGGVVQANTRSAALIETMPIEGVTLSMSARQAFETLIARGYETELPDYEAWWDSSVTFTKGDASDPEGLTQILLARQAETGRLVSIHRSTERTAARSFDGDAELAPIRSHFSIPEDARNCDATPGAAMCGIESPDKKLTYLYIAAQAMRSDVVQRLGVMPTAGARPAATSPAPRPGVRFADADTLPVPALPDPSADPCSLTVMDAAVNPVHPALAAEADRVIRTLRSRFADPLRTPDHLAESRVSIQADATTAPLPWCTTPFALSDVEWMVDHDLIDPDAKQDEVIDRYIGEAAAETGLTEAQIRQIIDGTTPAGVSDQQAYRLYQFMKEVGRRELAREVAPSHLIFHMASPHALTQYVGFMGDPFYLKRETDVMTRHAGIAGWPENAAANLLVSLLPTDTGPAAPAVYTAIQPGSRHVAVAHAHPTEDDYLDRSHPSTRAPETQTSLYSHYVGDFVKFTCNGESAVAFQGEQRSYWGYLQGEFVVDANWDPASDWIEGRLELTGDGQVEINRYSIRERDDPDCPYRTDAEDLVEARSLRFEGEIRIPNRTDVPGLPTLKGRPVRVGAHGPH